MNSSGFVMYVLLVAAFFLLPKKGGQLSLLSLLKKLAIMAAVFSFLFVAFMLLLDTNVGQVSVGRASSNSMESRFSIWLSYIDIAKILSSLAWGGWWISHF